MLCTHAEIILFWDSDVKENVKKKKKRTYASVEVAALGMFLILNSEILSAVP